MKIKYVFPLLMGLLCLSCNSPNVTEVSDYSTYLATELNRDQLLADAQLWTDKLTAHPEQFPYLAQRAAAYTQIFEATGEVSYLIKAEEDLENAIKMTNGGKPSYLKSLAANFIAQHRFKEALSLLKRAEANGEKLHGTQKMLFDVHLELGNDLIAEGYLRQIKNNADFDYHIRLAKWKDHKGNLEGAIIQMEKAMAIAEASNLKGMKQWAYTNLADFYGHAGDIEKSYAHYLKALELDATDAYAKKGIAWIEYAYERNPEQALKLLDHIGTYYKSPDIDLLKAEIADFKNDLVSKTEALERYKAAVKDRQYGAMYNKHNVLVYADEFSQPEEALAIAKQEVENRPTAQSYDLLAWSYFKMGEIESANAILEAHVDGQTAEPEILYHMAEIYKAVGKVKKVKALRRELVASLYELGPTMAPKIKQL